MNEFETILKQLIRDEGISLSAYQDSLGYWTIGVGHLIDERRGGGITHEEAMYLLKNKILKHTKEVLAALPWADPQVIGSARFGALVNMSFQLGTRGLLKFPKMLAALQAGDYDEAYKQALDTNPKVIGDEWPEQTPARAKRVAEQIRTNQWV